jgi:hypothetical protein
MKSTLGLCCATAVASSLLTFVVLRADTLKAQLKFENSRVRATELVYVPGVPRDRFTRPTDEVIVFMDDCRYRRTDSFTGEKTVREHKAGDVIWHNKGEDAPVLENIGTKPYRTLLIELK